MNATPQIDAALVRALIADQAPQWCDLPVHPVAAMGWDNRSFHLGDGMLVRLPSGPGYSAQPAKEWACLPHLAPHLPVAIPQVLAQGRPALGYPYQWTVLSYIEGAPPAANAAKSVALAQDLGQALTALRKAPTGPGPAPGQHNYHRGGDVRIYDQDIRRALSQISNDVDASMVLKVWTSAGHSTWTQPPVWVHGDVACGNILTANGRLAGLIDFGCCAVGDPACDLTIAWTLFDGAARRAFKNSMNDDPATWARARGWAVWKAALQIAKGDTEASQVMAAVLAEA